MVGGVSGVRADVNPFGFAFGLRAVLVGLNVVGLERRGLARSDLHRLRRAYRMLFFGGRFRDQVNVVAKEFADDPQVGKIVAFLSADKSGPIMQPARRSERGRHDDGIPP